MVNDESKLDKFIRIAEARTNKIIAMVQLLGNCANQSLYEYDVKDVDKIFSAIQNELNETKRRFNKQDSKRGNKFTLK